MKNSLSGVFGIFLACLLVLFSVLVSPAQSASSIQMTFSWDPNPTSENVTTYRIWQGIACPTSGPCDFSKATKVGEVSLTGSVVPTSLSVVVPVPSTGSFRVTAVNELGLESPPSDEATLPSGHVLVGVTSPGKSGNVKVQVSLPGGQ